MEFGTARGTMRRCRKVREGKGTNERKRVVGRVAGDECVFIPCTVKTGATNLLVDFFRC